jgi:hypothetical protein
MAGKTRIRLARMIEAAWLELGYVAHCDPDKLRPCLGAWRTNKHLGVMPWDGSCMVEDRSFASRPLVQSSVSSWWTMSFLVQRGFTIDQNPTPSASPWETQLYPKLNEEELVKALKTALLEAQKALERVVNELNGDVWEDATDVEQDVLEAIEKCKEVLAMRTKKEK